MHRESWAGGGRWPPRSKLAPPRDPEYKGLVARGRKHSGGGREYAQLDDAQSCVQFGNAPPCAARPSSYRHADQAARDADNRAQASENNAGSTGEPRRAAARHPSRSTPRPPSPPRPPTAPGGSLTLPSAGLAVVTIRRLVVQTVPGRFRWPGRAARRGLGRRRSAGATAGTTGHRATAVVAPV